ncbi:NF-kappa-B inhibitor zeta-like isoform X1 [Trematomus bernacchii]|uniref:NF-kappa-B inhibitor zeta-like isoform X1 n=1 Tax=Trematomus bernacchii TaxID=40690 RepID=UPI00146A174E|nr:NF-kappa-B inhibitor zeta-like isoform X1 [Trematomus bernacchii]
MLDPRRSEFLPMGANFNQNPGFLIADPRPREYAHAMHKKTVKELLMMRRFKQNGLQDDNNFMHELKTVKSEAIDVDVSPQLFGPPGYPHISNGFPENGHNSPQQLQHPTPADGGKLTLFHWQIQQQAQRLGGVSPELLSMQDADGDTVLHIAVAQGRRALAYVIAAKMSQCGSLDIKEHNGQTALQIAAASNQQLIVQDLLVHGAQINTRDLWGRSPLHLCAEKGHFLSLQSICRTLKVTGQQVDIEMFNYDGLTPLHAAVLSHNAVVKELRTLGNLCSYMAKELAQRAHMYVECIKTLLLTGASSGTKDQKSGRTCLHMAAEEANVELLKMFLDQPQSAVNAKTFSGNTALHIVSSLQNHKRQVEAVKLLMRKGADPGARNFENELPCQLVPRGPTGEKVQQLLKGNIDMLK